MLIRPCQVRISRMREERKNNPRLLEMDGGPGKMYLEGFLPNEFVKIANLITKHGGIVVSPDDETIILSKECDSRKGRNDLRFHVQWLYDCIRDNRLLNIGKYLVPRAPVNPQQATLTETIAILQAEQPMIIDRKLSNTSDENFERRKQLEHSKTGQYEALEQGEKSTKVNRSLVNKQRSSSSKLVDDSIDDSEEDTPPDDEERLQSTRKKYGGSKKRPHHVLKGRLEKSYSSPPKKQKKADSKKQKNASLSSSMKKLKVDISKCLTAKDNMECESSNEADDISLKISANSSKNNISSSEEGMDSSKSWKDGGSFGEEMEKTSNHNDSLDKSNVSSKTTGRRGRYSREETQKIIEYLTENNLLSKANKIDTWRELAATEMFQKRGRSALSLRKHYRRITADIADNDDEYSTDPKVTDEIEKKERKKLKNILSYFNVSTDSKNDDEMEEDAQDDDHNDQNDDHNEYDDNDNAPDDGPDDDEDQ